MTEEEAIDKLTIVANYIGNPAKAEIIEAIRIIEQPWISVKDDLPCNHEDLIIKHDDWEILETKPVFVHYKNGGFGIRHMWKPKNEPWIWFPNTSDIDYWMPIPELPKE